MFVFVLANAYCCPFQFTFADSNDFVIMVDPGHGCTQLGFTQIYDGEEVKEYVLNLKIAHYLKAILEQYQTEDGRRVKVYLTHNDDLDEPLILSERVKKGVNLNAEVLISLHNNAKAAGKTFSGSMIIVTNSHYKPKDCRFDDLYEIEQGLGESILSSLETLGIERSHCIDTVFSPEKTTFDPGFMCENGFLRRLSDNGSTYKNGDTTDWYGINYHGSKLEVPSIIVEHAYLDNPGDYYRFLSTDKKLFKVALADANGIANYYNLVSAY